MDIKINSESGSTQDVPFDDKIQPSIKELEEQLDNYDKHLELTSTEPSSFRMQAVNELAANFKLPKKYPNKSTAIKTKDEPSSTALDLMIDIHQTELGNAKRLIYYHGQNIRYCHGLNKWFTWDSKRWKIDNSQRIHELAKDTIEKIYQEVSRKKTDKEKEALAKHALRSESDNKINAMLSLAQSDPKVSILPEELDKDQWLFNCQNGVLDLKNLIIKTHDKNDLITKICSAEFDPGAKCERWLAFLDTIMDKDQEMVSYLQKCVGYSLTGSNREQCFFLLFGLGDNGKSTFLNVIRTLLNDYATEANPVIFLAKKHDSASAASPDIARLRGSRFVSTIESEEDKRLAESFIKTATGGDTIVSRPLYKESIEYIATFKIWFATNHKPAIKGTDHAIWRRVRLIPFEVTIPDSMKVKDYSEILKQEIVGILNWAIEGCRMWLEDELIQPKKVINATAQYRIEMDIIGDFLKDICDFDSKDLISKAELYEQYIKWCEKSKEYQLTQKKFGMRIQERGFDEYRRGSNRFWVGISIKKK